MQNDSCNIRHTPSTRLITTSSTIQFEELSDILNKKINKKEKAKSGNKKNRCPFMRRPRNNECINGGIIRKNAYGDDCCYKK